MVPPNVISFWLARSLHSPCPLQRILPIQFTTEASKPSIIAALTPLLPQLDPSQSYAIDFSARNNAPLSSAKMEIINAVAALIPNKVNLKEPEQKVEIHIVKSVAMVCVVKEFGRMGRWNLQRALGAVE